MKSLRWESAATEEPGDQNAPSAIVAHGWWAIGPATGGEWSCELIEIDDAGDEITTGGVDLGRFTSEQAAKEAAQTYESENS